MKYNIVAIGDIHWGAMNAEVLYEHLSLLPHFLKKMNGEIDLVVINGDYYDYRLALNSKSAILSIQWFDELVETCRTTNVERIRMIRGTKEHDNEQLEAFRIYEEEDAFFRIFNTTTVEETLPGLHCIYCPDENMSSETYQSTYINELVSNPDIGFFHGSFDVVLPNIVVQESEETGKENVIYDYQTFGGLIKGPMIASHWHDAYRQDPLIYIGSFDRWSFGEEEPKGFGFVQYDTDTTEYLYRQIENPYAIEYHTITAHSSLFRSDADYQNLMGDMNRFLEEHPTSKLRLLFCIEEENSQTLEFLQAIKLAFANNRAVKITVKNLYEKKKKNEKKKTQKQMIDRYSFVFDASQSHNQIIQKFLLEKFDQTIPLEEIATLIRKYMGEEQR